MAEKEIHVYYGLEVLEVVPNDPCSPAYRLLGARLYNAGLRVRTLEAVFGLDRKTLRKWGLALRSGDRKWLAEVLATRSGRRKLTLEMESYVRFRWLAMQAERRRDYRRRLQEELERVFGVRVSGETLRPLLRQLRGGGGAQAGSVGEEAAGAPSASVEPTEARTVPDPLEVGEVPSGANASAAVGFTPVLPGIERWVEAESAGAPSGVEVVDQRPPGQTVAAVPSVGGESVEVPGVCLPERALVLPVTSKIVPPIQDRSASAPAPALSAGEPADPLVAPISLASRSSPSSLGGPAAAAPSVGGESVAVPEACPPEGLVLPASGKVFSTAQDWPVGQTVWCEHAGLLLFGEALVAVSQVVEPAQPWLRQALGSVLAGALNVEQTKFLNLDDLESCSVRSCAGWGHSGGGSRNWPKD